MGSGWRLATLHGKRAGFPVRSRWSATGRNKKAARLVAGFVTLETLSGWGARYPEKKARREKVSLTLLLIPGVRGHEFCVGFAIKPDADRLAADATISN